jgi:hypothetical protein
MAKSASRQVLRANRFKTSFAQTRKVKAPRSERRKVAKAMMRTLSIIN